MLRLLTIASLVLLLTPQADAGCGLFGRARARRTATYSTCGAQATYAPSYAPVLPTAQSGAMAAQYQAVRSCDGNSCSIRYVPVSQSVAPVESVSPDAPRTLTYPVAYRSSPDLGGGDSYGFLGWINGVRARAGLGGLRWSSQLEGDAARNSSYGFGHNFMGGARRQNAGVGALQTVESMWLNSPAHAAAILDPSISEVGLANVNGVWTMSAR